MQIIENLKLGDWLLTNGGPVIRYRTASELLGWSGADVEPLETELLAAPMVHTWLARLANARTVASYNGSNPDAFDNSTSKLADLGLHAGMPLLDTLMAPYRDLQVEQVRYLESKPVYVTPVLTRLETEPFLADYSYWSSAVAIAARLVWFGYRDEATRWLLRQRLNALYALSSSSDYKLYIDQDTFGDFPNNPFRKRQLVDPRFYAGLPVLNDIYALAHYPVEWQDQVITHKIQGIIDYVLHPSYQALDEGYGVMRVGPRHYYGMGYSIHLPGYNGPDGNCGLSAAFVQRLELMAHFPTAVCHPYFSSGMGHLETFRTAERWYRFPACYLGEANSGYWIKGAYMRLEENRRSKTSLDIESTFRMLLIKKLASIALTG